MSETLNKLNKISEIAGLIAKICMVLLTLGIAAAVILICVVGLDPNFLTNLSESEVTITNGQILTAGVTLFFGAVIGMVILYYLDRLFTNIHKNNTPFTDENVKSLKTIAILLVIFTIVVPAVSALTAYALDAGYDWTMQFNVISLFAAFIVYFLSLIFQHGTALQKESDETL